MGALNCKGRLSSCDDEQATYEYWHDYFTNTEVTGTFVASFDASHPRETADHTRCVAALRHKVLQSRGVSGRWPIDVYFVS
ncbi:MAG: hypothetical protein R3B99_04435 [Polyangiales bacterium]